MTRALRAALLSCVLGFVCTACAAEKQAAPEWLLRTWTKTLDEDNGPADSITFRADGTFVTYDEQCSEHANRYFVDGGLVFLVIPMEKGPVALVLKPERDHSSMTFTSPRTRNNAVYAASDSPHCNRQY